MLTSDKSMRDSYLFHRSFQDEPADHTPTLRSWASPDHDALTCLSEFAECGDHVGSPDPGTREKHEAINLIIFSHRQDHLARLGFCGDDQGVSDHINPMLAQSPLVSFNDLKINKRD
jgi:hypothetical protein